MKILVVIDMQNDFIDGSLGTSEAQGIVPNVAKLIENFDGKIFATRDTHFSDYLNTLEGKLLPVEHCIINTEGWNIHNDILKAGESDFSLILNKHTFGCGLLANEIKRLSYDNDIKSIEVCGLCTDICVISNVLMLREKLPNTPIIVYENCCAGVTPEKHAAALEVMKSCQIEVKTYA